MLTADQKTRIEELAKITSKRKKEFPVVRYGDYVDLPFPQKEDISAMAGKV